MSASQLFQVCHAESHTPTQGAPYVWHVFLCMALLPFVWPCACHSPGFLCEKRPSKVFTTSSQLAAQIGPQTGTSSIAAACFATRPLALPLIQNRYMPGRLECLTGIRRPSYKALRNTTRKAFFGRTPATSLQLACVSRIYHRPCSNYTVFAGANGQSAQRASQASDQNCATLHTLRTLKTPAAPSMDLSKNHLQVSPSSRLLTRAPLFT